MRTSGAGRAVVSRAARGTTGLGIFLSDCVFLVGLYLTGQRRIFRPLVSDGGLIGPMDGFLQNADGFVYGRLVQFLEDVLEHAEDRGDHCLESLVLECREDLAHATLRREQRSDD